MIENIRREAERILKEGVVDLVIGFEEGTIPLKSTPVFIEKPEEAQKLVWNSFCENNLAVYINRFKDKKVGIVANGCCSRAIVNLIIEGQIKRDDVYIIGVPCEGMLDRRKMLREGKTEKDVDESYLYTNCRYCGHRNPVIYDYLAGEKLEEHSAQYPDIKEMESLTEEERWQKFSEEVNRCIRCYACRQACPMCYCEVCFVDVNNPKWLEGGVTEADVGYWNLGRAYHLAGRCVDCGACERACPMEIKILNLTRKLNKDVKELYNYEPGIDINEKPVLGEFTYEDKEDFIR